MKSLDKTFNKLNMPFFSYTEHIVHTTLLITHYARVCVTLLLTLWQMLLPREYVHVVQ
jgi:hypothetical protein